MERKATGVVRKIDELGRIVIPVELRRTLGIEEKDPIEIFTEGDTIILRKYQPACVFCGQVMGVIEHKDKKVCVECIKEIGGLG